MFNCRKNTKLVSENLDRELSFYQRMSMTMHGLMCGACRAYRRQIEALEALIKRHYQQPTDDAHKPREQTTHDPTTGASTTNSSSPDSHNTQAQSTSSHRLSQATRQEIQKIIDTAVDEQKNK